jgi:hypothetical protein
MIGGPLGDRRLLAAAPTAAGATTIALLAGIAVGSSLGQTGPALAGTVIAAMTPAPLTILALRRASGSAPSSREQAPRAHRVARRADAVAAG